MTVHIIPNELRIVDERGQELTATHVRCKGRVTAVRAASGPLFECANCGPLGLPRCGLSCDRTT